MSKSETSENLEALLSQTNPPLRQRRQRTNFNDDAICSLEEAFAKNPYPDINERESMAKELKTTEDRIQVWFQNKRARYRKKMHKENKTSDTKPKRSAAKSPASANTKSRDAKGVKNDTIDYEEEQSPQKSASQSDHPQHQQSEITTQLSDKSPMVSVKPFNLSNTQQFSPYNTNVSQSINNFYSDSAYLTSSNPASIDSTNSRSYLKSYNLNSSSQLGHYVTTNPLHPTPCTSFSFSFNSPTPQFNSSPYYYTHPHPIVAINNTNMHTPKCYDSCYNSMLFNSNNNNSNCYNFAPSSTSSPSITSTTTSNLNTNLSNGSNKSRAIKSVFKPYE